MKHRLRALEARVKSATAPPPRWGLWEFGVIGLLWLAVIAVSWPWMTRLGLYNDEAYPLPAAIRMAFGSPEGISFPDGIYLFGRPFPFMNATYIGSVDTYLYALVFAIFGVDVLAFRLTNLGMSLLIIALTYALTRRLADRLTAVFAALFLALDVEFLLFAPTNLARVITEILLSTVAVLLLVRWRRGSSNWRAFAPFFCLGLALSQRLTFIFFLPSLLFAGLLFYHRAILDRITLRILTIATVAFLIGCLPLVLFLVGNANVVFGLTETTSHFPDASTVEQRFQQFRTAITGQWSINYIAGQIAEPESEFWSFRRSSPLDGTIGRFSAVWWLFWASLIPVAVAMGRRLLRRQPLSPEARLCGFLGVLSLGVIGCTAFFGEGGKVPHLMLMFPFIHCVAAITLVSVWNLAYSRHEVFARAVAVVLLGLVVATAASTMQNMRWHNAYVARTGGTGAFASEISQLATWIARHPESHYVFATWGLYRPVYTLTAGKCPCTELWSVLLHSKPPPRADGYWEKQLSQQNSVFVFGKSSGNHVGDLLGVGWRSWDLCQPTFLPHVFGGPQWSLAAQPSSGPRRSA